MPFYLGLDLGQTTDYTAVILVEQTKDEQMVEEPPAAGSPWTWRRPRTVYRYAVRGIKRYQLQTPYPTIVEDVCQLLQAPAVRSDSRLIIDGSGVGRSVVDLFWRQVRGTV